MKRLAAFFRVIFLLMFLGVQIVLPVKAYAFVFLPFVATAGGSALAQAAVGAAVGAVAFVGLGSLGGDTTQTGGSVPHIPIDKNQIKQPPGWSRDATGNPTPPSVSPTVTGYYLKTYNIDLTGTNADMAKQAGTYICVNILGRTFVSASFDTFNGLGQPTEGQLYCNPGGDRMYIGTKLKCPTGYTLSGSTCNLSSASSVQKPLGTPCQILRTGNSFAYDASNPSCPVAPASNGMIASDGSTIGVNGGTVTVVPALGTNATTPEAAKPVVTVTPNASGTTTVNQQITYVYNNQTYTTNVNTEIDAGGKVVGQSQVTQAGAGTLTQPGTANPEQKSVTCTDIGTCDVAKDGTLQGVKTGVEQVRDKLTVQGTTPNTTHDPLYTKGTKTLTSVWNSFKASLASTAIVTFATGFFSVNVSGSCPTWSTSLGMGLPNLVIDHLCTPMADNMFAVVRGVLLVLAAWAAFRIAIDN